MKKFFKTFWPFLAMVGAWLCLTFLLASCKTREFVEVERILRDTTYITKEVRDSVFLHDSVSVTERGDTVFVERWHTKYRERLRTDTVYRSRTDTVPKPYPVEKLVERQLSWWQRLRLGLGSAVLIGLVGFVGWRLRRFLH